MMPFEIKKSLSFNTEKRIATHLVLLSGHSTLSIPFTGLNHTNMPLSFGLKP